MLDGVLYQQINKDHAFWTEKRRHTAGPGGNTAGLLTHAVDGQVTTNILFDAGLGTIEGLCDLADFDWSWPLDVVVTHAHADHHAELQLLSDQWCKRNGPRRDAIRVHAHSMTLDRLRLAHARGFEDGRTLHAVELRPGERQRLGIFTVTGIDVDHMPGAMIYAVEFGAEKLVVAWDLKTPPSPLAHPLLQRPSLALIEANTWTALSSRTNHTSVEELVRSGFIQGLRLDQAPGTRHGAYLVHYSGAEDAEGPMSDQALAARLARQYPDLAARLGVARRGQQWRFPA
jgi:phosphoribosyl 1,2-cyclic phosphodiesterase